MTIIDDIQYNPRETYSKEDTYSAYKELFNPNSLVAKIVLQDLMTKTNYVSTAVCSDTNVFYHTQGMIQVINWIKDGIMTPIIDEDQIVSNVDINNNI